MSRRRNCLVAAFAAVELAAVIPAAAQAAAPSPAAGGAFSPLAIAASVVPQPVSITIVQTGVTSAAVIYFTLANGDERGLAQAICTLDGTAIPCDVQLPLQLTGLTTGPHSFTAPAPTSTGPYQWDRHLGAADGDAHTSGPDRHARAVFDLRFDLSHRQLHHHRNRQQRRLCVRWNNRPV